MDGGGVIGEAGQALDIDALPRVATATARGPSEFEAVVRAERPLVIRGLLEAWPALAAGRQSPAALNAYLKAMDTGAMAPVMEASAVTGGRFGYGADLREFAFSKRQAGITETLDRIESLLGWPDPPFVAIQMLPLASHMPAFVAQNPLPLMPFSVTPRLWVGGAVRTQTHNDRDHNLACVIAGRRRFVLFPPTQVANLYVGPMDNPPPLSLVDPEAPDLARFPRYRDAYAAAQVAWLEPGDALFVPKYWWHHVTSLEPYNAMVNWWWGDTGAGLEKANDVFLASILAFKHLPPGERAYWKAMFETHVFAEGDEATAHIPDGLKGALGPMSPSFREALKRQLKMAFLKGGA